MKREVLYVSKQPRIWSEVRISENMMRVRLFVLLNSASFFHAG
jgi:hypothetical protein